MQGIVEGPDESMPHNSWIRHSDSTQIGVYSFFWLIRACKKSHNVLNHWSVCQKGPPLFDKQQGILQGLTSKDLPFLDKQTRYIARFDCKGFT